MTRASVLSERCRVLLYQVISLSEKLLKGFSTPVLAPWVRRVGCATGSPIFQGVGYPEKKPVYNSGCDGRGCGRLVLLFSLASQGLSLCDGSWKRRGSGWSWVDTGEPADIPKLYLSHHTTLLCLSSLWAEKCPLCLIMESKLPAEPHRTHLWEHAKIRIACLKMDAVLHNFQLQKPEFNALHALKSSFPLGQECLHWPLYFLYIWPWELMFFRESIQYLDQELLRVVCWMRKMTLNQKVWVQVPVTGSIHPAEMSWNNTSNLPAYPDLWASSEERQMQKERFKMHFYRHWCTSLGIALYPVVCFVMPWCVWLCSWTLISSSSPPWEKEQRHPRFLEAWHEIVSKLAGHRHDSEHLFISSRNDHNGISVAMSTAKTKLLWPVTGPLGPGSTSGFVVAALWGSWGLP